MWSDLPIHECGYPCATEGCQNLKWYRLEVEGVGSNYCESCHAKIERSEGEGHAVQDFRDTR